jgi:glycosyltransferase involved in cell wall biosynthesis
MKILIVIDKEKSAIHRLAKAVKDYSPHLDIEILPVHPKRASVDTIARAIELMEWADIIDIHYWRSGEVVREARPDLFQKKPRVLFHMNPYDADNKEVNDRYEVVVVGNETIQDNVPYARLIPYGVDLDFFKFNEDYTEEKVVNMAVARIEGKKGVREVAQACKELGYKFRLVGRVSKPDYMKQVIEVGGKSIEFLEDVSDEKLREVYYGSAIHVCNSVSNFESGSLPILENMAVGVPVLTRRIGHVGELFNGKNMVIRKGEQEDLGDLKKNLKQMMENREWRLKLREKAWDTVKNRNIERMVRRVRSLYYDVYKPDKTFISVIMPTRDNPESFVEALVATLKQDWPKYEVVVADSGEASVREIIDKAREQSDVPIKYIHFPHKDNYTLAEARNRAVIEAEGEYLVFCDDRIRMKPDAITSFEGYKKPRTWLWGIKDGAMKSFVENFSFVSRADLINGGLFSERMQWYGGMTQEVKQRFQYGRGFNFALINEANAEGISKATSKRHRRDDIIKAKLQVFKMYG